MCQTLRCICVGNDPKSDGWLFYSPELKSLIGSAEYTLDSIPLSGPICGLEYDGGIQFDFHCDGDSIDRSPAYQINDTVTLLQTGKHGVIKIFNISNSQITYLLKYLSGNERVERLEHELSYIYTYHPNQSLSHDPPPTPSPLPLLVHNYKVTVFIPSIMKAPKQGFLMSEN